MFQARYVTLREGTEIYGPSRTSWYRLGAAKLVTLVKRGSRTMIDVASADAYFAGLPIAEIKMPSRSGKQFEQFAAASAANVPFLTDGPRRRGRLRKQPTPSALSAAEAPPAQPVEASPASGER